MRSNPTAREAALALTLALLAMPAPALQQEEPASVTARTTPEGVAQLLPRGAIPAIVDPVFTSASEAEIPDEAWILGVSIGGEARAYSLNLLNSHEVVNDRIGGRNFAAVW